MKTRIIILAVLTSTASAQAALLRLPIRVSPFGGSQSFQLTDNTGASISVSGETICTRDIPVSACISSTIVRGGGRVEFLISDSGSAVNLSFGDLLSSQPDNGTWGTSLLNRYDFLSSRSSPRDGTFSSESSGFLIGFRVVEDDGDYRYGWIDTQSDSEAFGTLSFSEVRADSLTVTPVPESSTALLAGLAALTLNRRTRHRSQSMTRA